MSSLCVRRRPSGPAAGFSLVELLVVTAVIGVLAVLLLPAVQAARESARRSQCANHLKQWATACLLHHEAHTAFPTAGSFDYFGGPHPRGFNAALCDGWVRTIDYQIELTAFQALCNRFDGLEFELP